MASRAEIAINEPQLPAAFMQFKQDLHMSQTSGIDRIFTYATTLANRAMKAASIEGYKTYHEFSRAELKEISEARRKYRAGESVLDSLVCEGLGIAVREHVEAGINIAGGLTFVMKDFVREGSRYRMFEHTDADGETHAVLYIQHGSELDGWKQVQQDNVVDFQNALETDDAQGYSAIGWKDGTRFAHQKNGSLENVIISSRNNTPSAIDILGSMDSESESPFISADARKLGLSDFMLVLRFATQNLVPQKNMFFSKIENSFEVWRFFQDNFALARELGSKLGIAPGKSSQPVTFSDLVEAFSTNIFGSPIAMTLMRAAGLNFAFLTSEDEKQGAIIATRYNQAIFCGIFTDATDIFHASSQRLGVIQRKHDFERTVFTEKVGIARDSKDLLEALNFGLKLRGQSWKAVPVSSAA